jgi:hypothetical protein
MNNCRFVAHSVNDVIVQDGAPVGKNDNVGDGRRFVVVGG